MIKSFNDTEYSAGKMNHAAAICPENMYSKGKMLIAFYSGDAECNKTQRVVIIRNDNGKITDSKELEKLTGNPILFEEEHQAHIIYTKFERFPYGAAKWWQYCSLWQRKITVIEEKIHLSVPKQIIFEEPPIKEEYQKEDLPLPPEGLGYVTKCPPIYNKNHGYFLPVYREHHPYYHGIILHSNNLKNWTYVGRIGAGENNYAIQPTIWFEKHKEQLKLCSLSRNFNRVVGVKSHDYALYSESFDFGKTWSELKFDKHYLNLNNSLVVLPRGIEGKPFVIWNNSSSGFNARSNMLFGFFRHEYMFNVEKDYSSYPAVAYDGDNKVHIVYTGSSTAYKCWNKRVIKHKQYDANSIVSYARKLTKIN